VTLAEEWLWGWDPTQGIVSVWAEATGRVVLWRRLPGSLRLVCETDTFRPWLLLDSIADLQFLGSRLRRFDSEPTADGIRYRELEGTGTLRFYVDAADLSVLQKALLSGASRRRGQPLRSLRDLGKDAVVYLPPEEQYLTSSGRNYFRGLAFDDIKRLTLDLETTGLDPDRHRIFLVALRTPDGDVEVLEAADSSDLAEADLLARVVERAVLLDPDVLENHHLHGFDLPFLARRAERLGVPLALGRAGPPGLQKRPAARGAALHNARLRAALRRTRYSIIGRECIDTLDAVRRHDFSARDLPGHGLKVVARHFGVAAPEREYVPGARVHATFLIDRERVRRYAKGDVIEAASVARLLGGAAFALAQMAPRRYERLADAGAATGVLDPLLVRAYVRAGVALPAVAEGDGTPHSGAALYLFATGVAERVVKADVASLYPSLMRQYRIGPERDRLGVLLGVIDQLVEQRLTAKHLARTLAPGSKERHANEALSAAMKLVINSAYGYLGAVGLTRFADVHAANEVTRHGRELLERLCRELASRGVTLLEADTDGVYFAVPAGFTEAD
jgi:DNA polymerase I